MAQTNTDDKKSGKRRCLRSLLSGLVPALAGGVGGPGAAVGVRLRLLGGLEVVLVRLLDHGQGHAHVLRELRAALVKLHDLSGRNMQGRLALRLSTAPRARCSAFEQWSEATKKRRADRPRDMSSLLSFRLAVPNDLVGGGLVEAQPARKNKAQKEARMAQRHEQMAA